MSVLDTLGSIVKLANSTHEFCKKEEKVFEAIVKVSVKHPVLTVAFAVTGVFLGYKCRQEFIELKEVKQLN